jgi:hypothetical protein
MRVQRQRHGAAQGTEIELRGKWRGFVGHGGGSARMNEPPASGEDGRLSAEKAHRRPAGFMVAKFRPPGMKNEDRSAHCSLEIE